jgi:tetratricopeptide (TPR) repeat protein
MQFISLWRFLRPWLVRRDIAGTGGPKEDCEPSFVWLAWQAHVRSGDDIVIRGCSQVIRRNKKAGWAYLHRGVAHEDKREYDRAVADYSKAIELDPSADAYYYRGSVYRKKGDFDRALADFSEVIRLTPDPTQGILARGDNLGFQLYTGIHAPVAAISARGDTYLAKGDHERAKADYVRAIALLTEPLNRTKGERWEGFHAQRARLHAKAGDYDSAIADFSECIDRGGIVYAERGDAYRKKGTTSALIDLNEATRSKVDTIAAYLARGDTYEAKGDRGKAIEDYIRRSRFAQDEAERDKQAKVAKRSPRSSLCRLQRSLPSALRRPLRLQRHPAGAWRW